MKVGINKFSGKSVNIKCKYHSQCPLYFILVDKIFISHFTVFCPLELSIWWKNSFFSYLTFLFQLSLYWNVSEMMPFFHNFNEKQDRKTALVHTIWTVHDYWSLFHSFSRFTDIYWPNFLSLYTILLYTRIFMTLWLAMMDCLWMLLFTRRDKMI